MPSLRLLAAAIGLALCAPALAADAAQATDRRHDAKRLEEITITASPLAPTDEDVIQPVEVITGAELDARKAGTLGETVAKEAGVQSSFFGAGVGRPIIRGLEGARVQVLDGGIGSMDASTVSADHAVSVEPFLADQIEVLKGPATLLYGRGAVGGAVNVVDGRIPETLVGTPLTGRAELRGNTVDDGTTGSVRLDGSSGNFAWHADALYRDTGDYDIPGFAESEALREAEHGHEEEGEDEPAFGVLPNSAVETKAGAFGGSWIGESAMIGASISSYRTLYGVPGHAHGGEEHEEDGHGGEHGEEEPVRIDLEQTRVDLKGALYAPFAGLEKLSFRAARNDYRHIELEGGEVGTLFENDGIEGRIEAVHAQRGIWRGAFGLQFGSRDFVAVGEEAFVPSSESRDLGLFWIEKAQMGLGAVELGARYDRVEVDAEGFDGRDFSALSLSAAGQIDVTDALHLRMGFDRAERAPEAEELFSNGPHLATRSFEIGNPDIGTETANEFELGLHLHHGPLRAKLAAFHNAFDDFIYLVDTGAEEDGLPVRQWSQADATFRGFEAEIELRMIDNEAGVLDLRLFGDTVDASLDDGGGLPRIAPARFGAGLTWKRGPWRAAIGAVSYADQDAAAAFETPTDGYTLVDAHLSYHWDTEHMAWELFADGSNLTDQEARVHTSFLKDVAPLPGRAVAFGVRAFF